MSLAGRVAAMAWGGYASYLGAEGFSRISARVDPGATSESARPQRVPVCAGFRRGSLPSDAREAWRGGRACCGGVHAHLLLAGLAHELPTSRQKSVSAARWTQQDRSTLYYRCTTASQVASRTSNGRARPNNDGSATARCGRKTGGARPCPRPPSK
jgi:hypothetical protein